MINSEQNKKVKEWAKLKDKKYRDITNTFLIESKHLVLEALKKNLVTQLILLEGSENIYGVEACYVSLGVMKKITNQVTPSDVCAVCKKIVPKKIEGNCLLLDDISDPGNLGTIIRSAVAFNMPNIVLSNNSVDLYNPKVIRSCEGMIFHVNIVREDLQTFILNHPNYQFYGTDVVDGQSITNKLLKDKIGIIIGNEGRGLSSKLKDMCLSCLYIPMNSNCESLNAAISASIIMYELNK